jgi:hypothetical protein
MNGEAIPDFGCHFGSEYLGQRLLAMNVETCPLRGESSWWLVQREMENGRSPLASIPPSSAGHPGEHRATQVAAGELGGELKLQLVSRKEKHVVWSALTQPTRVEEQTG